MPSQSPSGGRGASVLTRGCSSWCTRVHDAENLRFGETEHRFNAWTPDYHRRSWPSDQTTEASRREQRRVAAPGPQPRPSCSTRPRRCSARKGFHETTLKEVAELAEFSVGSVYSFFENKEDLYVSVFVRRGDEYMPALRAVFAGGDTPDDQLHRLVDFEVGFFRQHPQLRAADPAVVAPLAAGRRRDRPGEGDGRQLRRGHGPAGRPLRPGTGGRVRSAPATPACWPACSAG